jgi:hypothetical protein
MKHWTENDFTEWLYGLKSDSAHLRHCAECSGIAGSLERRKAEATRAPEVSSDVLAAQRRAIYARMDNPRRHWAQSRWSLSLAMLVLLVVASFGLLRRQTSTAPLVNPADAKLFSDLASIDQSSEPAAIKPIESLFEQ